jgi:hypothetical protein
MRRLITLVVRDQDSVRAKIASWDSESPVPSMAWSAYIVEESVSL